MRCVSNTIYSTKNPEKCSRSKKATQKRAELQVHSRQRELWHRKCYIFIKSRKNQDFFHDLCQCTPVNNFRKGFHQLTLQKYDIVNPNLCTRQYHKKPTKISSQPSSTSVYIIGWDALPEMKYWRNIQYEQYEKTDNNKLKRRKWKGFEYFILLETGFFVFLQ